MLPDRLPPQSLEAEQSALGGALISKNACALVLETAHREAFYLEAHRMVFDAMQNLQARDMPVPVDVVTLAEELRRLGTLERCGGKQYVDRLADTCETAAHTDYYLRIVMEKWALRRLIQAGADITRLAFEEQSSVERILSEAEQLVMAARPMAAAGEFTSQALVADQALDRLTDGEMDFGVETGLLELDAITNGWQDTDLIIVAGRPGMGKTAKLLSLARAGANTQGGCAVAVFSLEMSKEQLMNRQIAHYARLDMSRLRRKWELTLPERAKIAEAASLARSLTIDINDQGEMPIDRLRANARRWRRNHKGRALILVDYLQHMPWPGGSQNENNAIETNAKGLKNMAKELGCPVVCLSQLTRANEKRENKRPALSDLRGSGGIEQEADVVVFIHRPDYYQNEDKPVREQSWPQACEIIVAKHRNGPLGTVQCAFDGRFGDFLDCETRYDDGDVPPDAHEARGGY